MRANGIVIRCPGLFQGETIITLDQTRKSLIIAMMSTLETVESFSSCFRELCKSRFTQCIHRATHSCTIILTLEDEGSKVSNYCPECVEACYSTSYNGVQVSVSAMAEICTDDQVCKNIVSLLITYINYSTALQCNMKLKSPLPK